MTVRQRRPGGPVSWRMAVGLMALALGVNMVQWAWIASLEELREMDGEPVYLDLGDGGAWVLLRVQQGKVFVTHKNTICVPVNILFECGGKAYRRRPEDENI